MRRFSLGIALLVVIAAGALGFQLTHSFGPQRLEGEVRGWLAEATGRPVGIDKLRLVLGFPIQIEADGLELWDGALRVERASARLDFSSMLAGQPKLSRLRLDGAHLQIGQVPDADGDGFVWSPPVFESPDVGILHEPALTPLVALGSVVRTLLSQPLLADTLIVRRSQVSLEAAPGEARVLPSLYRVNGRLLHSRLFDDARLFLRVSPGDPDGARGTIEWTGTRDPSGELRLAMATAALDLSLLAPYAGKKAKLAGTLDGLAEFTTVKEGTGTLTLDAVARDFLAALPQKKGEATPWRAPVLSGRLTIAFEPDKLTLSNARIQNGPLEFSLDGSIARPVQEGSRTRISIGVGDLAADRSTAETLSSWLHPAARESVRSVTDRIESGRIKRARLSGVASLDRWRQALRGQLDPIPRSFRLELDVADLSLAVDDSNRIDDVFGSFAFANDTLTATSVRGNLNDGPLPSVDLTFTGLGHLLNGLPDAPTQSTSAQALVGLTPLWEKLRSKDPDRKPPPSISIEIDHLHHPALLWPVDGVTVDLELEPDREGMRMIVAGCRWAGVLLDGSVDWELQPERHLGIALTASPDPEAVPKDIADSVVPHDPNAWASGRFRVGAMDGRRWRQRSASGHFSASEGTVALREIQIAMDPMGDLTGDLSLDLSLPDAVPYVLDARLRDSDGATIIEQIGGSTKKTVSGVLSIEGALRGTVVPERALLHDADGRLVLDARAGEIQRAMPPVLAIAMAGESLNPFSSRDVIRYRSAKGTMKLTKGRIATEGLDVDGPDVRMFIAGNVDLSSPPYAMEAELALFLFRQIDWAVGKIPILNSLLLGKHENFVAAYFQLVGSWKEPVARMQPLRTLEEGPVDVLTKGIPRVVKRGLKAIGGVLPWRPGSSGKATAPRAADEGAPHVDERSGVPGANAAPEEEPSS